MMRNYIVTARPMDTSSASATYDPVDFAVAQKSLPQICGTEDARETCSMAWGHNRPSQDESSVEDTFSRLVEAVASTGSSLKACSIGTYPARPRSPSSSPVV